MQKDVLQRGGLHAVAGQLLFSPGLREAARHGGQLARHGELGPPLPLFNVPARNRYYWFQHLRLINILHVSCRLDD